MKEKNKIFTRRQRLKLAPRNYPYFTQISVGRGLGYRKTKTGGSWIARRVKRHKKVGGTNIGFPEALRHAKKWFDRLDGGAIGRYTVRQAIDDYAHHVEAERCSARARAYRCTMARHVPESMMEMEIDRLTVGRLTDWLHSLVIPTIPDREPIAQASANLVLTNLRTALNYVYKKRFVNGARVWTEVQAFKQASKRRDLYLTSEQISRLLNYAEGFFRNYCLLAILTGARPGELASIRVRDYIQEHGTLRLSGKTGERTILLSKEALELMKRLTWTRMPASNLLITRKGEPWNARSWGYAMEKVRHDARLPKDTVVYSLRHYYISRALLAGVSVQLIEKNCGTSMDMISKYYGKFIAPDQANMLDKVVLIPINQENGK